jgi:diguanylate cyclase (GGDEF)-like protein
VARFGGEEFLVVLRAAGANAGPAMERLMSGWRRTEPLTTFSAGVAVHAADAKPAATLIAADRALYRAKDAGRDCVRDAADPDLAPALVATA